MSSPYYFNKYKIETYREIQDIWLQIYKNLKSEFSLGNKFNVIFPDRDRLTIKDFSVFDHECRVSLSPFLAEDRIFGKLHFDRMTGRDERKTLLVFYIDEHGNMGQDPQKQLWNLSRAPNTDFDRFGISLTEAFFESFDSA